MSDLPDRAALSSYSNAAFNVLQRDMLAERASSLGYHSRLAEASVKAFRAFEGDRNSDERLMLLRRAARDVWAYFVQREACGFRNHNEIIKDFAIPGEVLARLGAIER